MMSHPRGFTRTDEESRGPIRRSRSGWPFWLRGVVCVAAFGLLGPLPWLSAADIRGKITLKGTPPPEVKVDLTDFPDVQKAYPALVGKLTTRHYVVSPAGELANVFVYVKEGLEGRTFPLATNTPLLNQTNAGFYPYMLGLQTNQVLLIRNSEPYMDSPKAEPKNNPEFNIAQPMTGMIARVTFEHPEVLVRMKCAIHTWEFAFIGVVEHPFFAVSSTDGVYELPAGLPAGKYVLEAVHPKAGRLTQEVTVGDRDRKVVDFAFDVPPPKK